MPLLRTHNWGIQQPPPGTHVDWQNPAAYMLRFLWIPTGGSSIPSSTNPANVLRFASTNSTLKIVPSSVGMVIDSPGPTTAGAVVDEPMSFANGFTFAFIANMRSNSSTYFSRCGFAQVSGGNVIDMIFGYVSMTFELYSWQRASTAITCPALNEFHSYVYSWNKATLAKYRDGALVGSTAITVAPTATKFYEVGFSEYPDRAPNCQVATFQIWERGISQTEVMNWCTAPYSMFWCPSNRRVFAPLRPPLFDYHYRRRRVS
jgi:hypothetical protein